MIYSIVCHSPDKSGQAYKLYPSSPDESGQAYEIRDPVPLSVDLESRLLLSGYLPTGRQARSLLTTCWDKLHGYDVIGILIPRPDSPVLRSSLLRRSATKAELRRMNRDCGLVHSFSYINFTVRQNTIIIT